MSNAQVGNVIHILQKNRLVQSKDQNQQIDGDLKFLTYCSIVISLFQTIFISLMLPLEVYW